MAASPWLAKVNASEAGEATGRRIDDPRTAIAASRAMRDVGARSVIVTLGDACSVLVTDDGSWWLGSVPVVGRYPVGSGDAFLGCAVGANGGAAGAGILNLDVLDEIRGLSEPREFTI